MNNVIVKFVHDDMVCSFNMKSAELFSVNDQWEKSFVEVNAHNLHLRKMLQLNDVTICLDKLDDRHTFRISSYQDPLIYRCSIQSRFDFAYSIPNSGSGGNNASAYSPSSPTSGQQQQQQLRLIRLNFYCRKFDVSITDQQLPMVIR